MKDHKESETPIEIIEGDGDNTTISRLKSELGICVKKRLSKNHVVKNIGKQSYSLYNDKSVKINKTVIIHLQKCLKYIFTKNQGNKKGLEENLKALIPHQFRDHTLCKPVFYGYLRKPTEKYLYRILPYKSALKDGNLRRRRLQKIFDSPSSRAEQYSELGSSKQCEHANKKVTLRAPNSHHYGNSESLDFRVHATAAFVNEGMSYIFSG